MTNTIQIRAGAAAGLLVLAAAALAVWGAARSEAIIIIGGKPAEMVGGGWVAAGDGSVRPQFQVSLPCPGDEVGFNPQPDPPGHDRARLTISVGGERYQLDELTGATCTIDDVEDREGATHEGSGLASCGGERGFIINWRLTDGGLGGPDTAGAGNPDTAEVSIRAPGEEVACQNNLHIAGPLGGGNFKLIPPTDPD